MQKRNIEATIREGGTIIRELASQIVFTNTVAETQAIVNNIIEIYERVCECLTTNNAKEGNIDK